MHFRVAIIFCSKEQNTKKKYWHERKNNMQPLQQEYRRLSALNKQNHLRERRRFNRQLLRYLEGGFGTDDWWETSQEDVLAAMRQSSENVSYVPGPNEWERTLRLYVRWYDGNLTFEIEFTGDEDVESQYFGSNFRGAVEQFARIVKSTEAEVVACLQRNIRAGLTALERARDQEDNEYAPTVMYARTHRF